MSDEYYVPLSEAAAVLRSRQQLRDEVMRFWETEGACFPPELASMQPSAIWARQLATWRFEDVLFADMARQAKLPTFHYTYEQDRFVSVSTLKRSYAQPMFATGLDKHGELITKRQRLIKNVQQHERTVLGDLVTEDGERLVDWHRARLDRFHTPGTILDATDHKKSWGNSLARDYLGLLSLLIAHGVLFEDYHGGESGDKLDTFTSDVFEPAFDQIRKRFGVTPLIVKMPWYASLALYPSECWCAQVLARTIPRAA